MLQVLINFKTDEYSEERLTIFSLTAANIVAAAAGAGVGYSFPSKPSSAAGRLSMER